MPPMDTDTIDASDSRQPAPPEAGPVITKACDMCRLKKIRCQPTKEGCAQCTNHQIACHFTPISTKRKPRRPAGHKQIAQLEERLKQMERLLKATLQSTKSGEMSTGPGEAIMDFASQGGPATGSHSNSSLVPVTIVSPAEMNPVVSQLTPQSEGTAQSPQSDVPLRLCPTSKLPMALGPYSLPAFQDLPPKPVALELVMDTFKSFNHYFPLFNEQDFLEKFEDRYLDSSPTDPAWWACINVVLALAHRFRSMRTFETEYDNARACGYMHNAFTVVAELNVLNNSLLAVQALVGMATVLQGTANSEPAAVLIASGVRLAQALGLHRRTPNKCILESELDQARRVFWFAYLMDKDISLRTEVPFAQDDDDMDVDLPSANLSILPCARDDPPSIDFFNSRIGLAVIQGQVYKRLYSVQAEQQPQAQKAMVAEELGSILSYWKSSVPVDLEDDDSASPFFAPLTPEGLHLLILRFAYLDCLVMIDRHLPPTRRFQVDSAPGGQGTFVRSESACVIECRKAMPLIALTPHGDYACVWLLLRPFFAAVSTLLQNIADNPESPHSRSDLRAAAPFIELLQVLAGEERVCHRSEEARKMLQACSELRDRASHAIESNFTCICPGNVEID